MEMHNKAGGVFAMVIKTKYRIALWGAAVIIGIGVIMGNKMKALSSLQQCKCRKGE